MYIQKMVVQYKVINNIVRKYFIVILLNIYIRSNEMILNLDCFIIDVNKILMFFLKVWYMEFFICMHKTNSKINNVSKNKEKERRDIWINNLALRLAWMDLFATIDLDILSIFFFIIAWTFYLALFLQWRCDNGMNT